MSEEKSCLWTWCKDYYTKDACPTTYYLTECGHKYKVVGRGWKFCPYCGKRIENASVVLNFLRGKEWKNCPK